MNSTVFLFTWIDYDTLKRETISFVLPAELKDLYSKDYELSDEGANDL